MRMPSGNGVAAAVLLRLGYLLGEPRYLGAAERTLRAAWAALLEYPTAHAHPAGAGGVADAAADRDPARAAAVIDPWRRELAAAVCAAPPGAGDSEDAHWPAAAARGQDRAPGGVAYVCRGSTCSAPLREFSALARALD